MRIIARTDEGIASFAPFVAAIGRHGDVAFQATLEGGRSALFFHDGSTTRELQVDGCSSHPAIAGRSLSFYATPKSEPEGLYVFSDERLSSVACKGDGLEAIGPLGPTMSSGGAIAFRGRLSGGSEAICIGHEGGWRIVDTLDSELRAFRGLPLISDRGRVIAAATSGNGNDCIVEWQWGRRNVIASTGPVFSELGAFPCLRDETVWVCGRDGDRRVCLISFSGGKYEIERDEAGRFDSVRGVLASTHGRRVFYATPAGEAMTIFEGTLRDATPLLAIGDDIEGDSLAAFALNPVSINGRGDVVVRLELESGAEAIAVLPAK